MSTQIDSGLAKMESDNAKRRILDHVATLRRTLDEIEGAIKNGRPPTGEVANMGFQVARMAENAGKLDLLDSLG